MENRNQIVGNPKESGKRWQKYMRRVDHRVDKEGFKCIECLRVFTTIRSVKQHISGQHLNITDKCPHCGEDFRNVSSLRKHIQRNHAELPQFKLTCPQCAFTCLLPKGLDYHLARVHNIIRTPTSPAQVAPTQGDGDKGENGNNISLKKKLKYPWLNFATLVYKKGHKKHKCLKCDKLYKTKRNLKDHIVAHHMGVMRPCPHCEDSFKHKRSLNSHIRKAHRNIKFTCHLCQKSLTYLSSFYRHLNVVHEITNPKEFGPKKTKQNKISPVPSSPEVSPGETFSSQSVPSSPEVSPGETFSSQSVPSPPEVSPAVTLSSQTIPSPPKVSLDMNWLSQPILPPPEVSPNMDWLSQPVPSPLEDSSGFLSPDYYQFETYPEFDEAPQPLFSKLEANPNSSMSPQILPFSSIFSVFSDE